MVRPRRHPYRGGHNRSRGRGGRRAAPDVRAVPSARCRERRDDGPHARRLIPHSWVLTTVGRRTGRERRNPVTVVDVGGRRWLVAPYGPVPWCSTRAPQERSG
ncbi:nitroreductase family deazaflavin-dependent oxidoreductase [Phycicoccus jejuensis]|uniref:nitroreductase/quinone reductase family protein n=1 Tax=Phycicoccus jejuensis TaxID=367299 RepID=UPI00384F4780